MKYILSVVFLLLLQSSDYRQILTPVKWMHTAPKGINNTYTINLQPGWHVYAELQPKKAVAQPLKIMFDKNHLVTVEANRKNE